MNQHDETKKGIMKSRHLSILDYYETLQIEWLTADLRRRIYPRLKDKNYWSRVQDGKKETIEKLAEKNSLPSIFTDDSMHRDFQKKLYKDVGLPAFVYKDQKHENEQSYYDILHYYALGADVRVDVFGDQKIGKITKNFIPYKDVNVFVTIEGEEKPYNTSTVTRIL